MIAIILPGRLPCTLMSYHLSYYSICTEKNSTLKTFQSEAVHLQYTRLVSNYELSYRNLNSLIEI